jgi:hypothetical protein
MLIWQGIFHNLRWASFIMSGTGAQADLACS